MSKHDTLSTIISLLAALTVFDSLDFQTFLKKLIRLLTDIVPVDSCLIYFFDRQQKSLILVASKRPHKRLLGKISMKTGEGITGWVADHKKTVTINKNAYLDRRFKYVKELPEDMFEAFLSVPIIDREGVVGVINFQNKKTYKFTRKQIQISEDIVRIVAAGFETVVLERKVNNLESRLGERKIIEKAKGLLMKERNLSEEGAYNLIRREAMNKRKTAKEIADAVILVYSSY